MPFTPVQFYKDGVIETASSAQEYTQYIWDGWSLVGDAPPTPASVKSLTVRKIEIVDVVPAADPANAGTLFLVPAP